MKYRDRVVGLIRVRPDRILANPINWRTHPDIQRSAMRGVLGDIGVGDALVAVPADEALIREALALKDFAARKAWAERFEAGTSDVLLLDGHMRAEEIRDQPVPVILLDLLPPEQAEFLATFDPIGALAGKHAENLGKVLRQFNSTNADVQALVAKVQGDMDAAVGAATGQVEMDIDDAFGRLPEGDKEPFQQMTFTLHDSQAEIVKSALEKAKAEALEGDEDGPNKNSNGNALHRICEAYLD